jgi:hypothetical protein
VSRIQPFDLYIDVNTNQTHYAWQAGVRRSLVSISIRLAAFQARGGARMKLHKVKKRTAEPKNIECRMSKHGIASLTLFFKKR